MSSRWISSPETRKALYATAAATTTFLGIKGIIDNNTVEYINLVLPLILSLAFVNVDTTTKKDNNNNIG